MDLRVWALLAGILALGFVGYLSFTVLRESEGNPRMREISLAIRQGATAFLRRALKIAFSSGAVMGFSVVGLGLLGLVILAFFFDNSHIWLGFAFGASSV